MTTLSADWMHTAQVKQLFAALDYNARFVGGCVRNALLRRDVSDVDIATPLLPQQLMQVLQDASIKVIPTGLAHGTVTAVMDDQRFEITTLRKDTACDGRHAQVVFTDDWQADAARRDFTVNAMSCDYEGTLYDYFGGVKDLQKGCIRFVGNAQQRCVEDYLRVLRFFRFFAYYGSNPMDNEALAACQNNTVHLQQLSAERIQSEMKKLLNAPNPFDALTAMQQTGVLSQLLGADIDLDPIQPFLRYQAQLKIPQEPMLMLALLVRSSHHKIDAKKLAAQWKLSNNDTNLLIDLCSPSLALTPDMSQQEQKAAILHYGEVRYLQLVLLSWALEDDARYKAKVTFSKDWQVPFFPLKGEDLLQAGYTQGRAIGQLLQKAKRIWQESDYQLDKQGLLEALADASQQS